MRTLYLSLSLSPSLSLPPCLSLPPSLPPSLSLLSLSLSLPPSPLLHAPKYAKIGRFAFLDQSPNTVGNRE